MAADLGAVAGPVAAGWLADDVSYSAGFGVTAGVLALGLLAAIFSRETRPSARPRQTESVAPHEEGA
jgi:dipeptide/tripeptide permease